MNVSLSWLGDYLMYPVLLRVNMLLYYKIKSILSKAHR